MWAKKINTELYQNWLFLYRSEMNETTNEDLLVLLQIIWYDQPDE